MKKILFVMLASIMILSLVAACTATPQTTPAATTAPEKTAITEQPSATDTPAQASTEKRVLHIIGSTRTYPGEEDAWKEVIAAFEKEYNVTVEVKWSGKFSDIPQMLETARMAGEPVDISSAGAGIVNSTLARSGIIMDMTDFIKPFESKFAKSALSSYYIDGKLWGIPYGASSTTSVFYNKTMFDELGLSEPKTYAELLTVAKTIKDKKGIIPMIHDGKTAYFWPIWYFETYAQETGGKSVDMVKDFLSGKAQFTGKAEAAAFNDIAQFYKDGILTQESLDTDTDAKFAVFAQQKAAMFFAGSWHLSPVRAVVGDSFEIGEFPFPVVVDGATSQPSGGPGDAFVIPSFADPKNYGLSRQFLEFIMRKDIATKILSCRDPLGPSVASVPDSTKEPLAAKMEKELFPNNITFLDWIWPTEINDAFVADIPAVLSGNMTAEDATKDVQKAYDTLVKEKDYKFDWWTNWTSADWDKVTMKNLPDIEVKE